MILVPIITVEAEVLSVSTVCPKNDTAMAEDPGRHFLLQFFLIAGNIAHS